MAVFHRLAFDAAAFDAKDRGHAFDSGAFDHDGLDAAPPEQSADLVFSHPAVPAGPVHLVFGDNSVAQPLPASISVVGRLPALRGAAPLLRQQRFAVVSRLPALRGGASARYVSDTARPTTSQTVGSWSGADSAAASQSFSWQGAGALPAGTAVAWQQARPSSASVQQHWDDAQRQRRSQSDTWQSADPLRMEAVSGWQDALRDQRLAQMFAWQRGMRASAETVLLDQDALRDRRQRLDVAWSDADRRSASASSSASAGLPLRVPVATVWQYAMQPTIGSRTRPTVPPVTVPCYTPPSARAVALLFAGRPVDAGDLLFLCDRDADQAAHTIVVPIRRAYVIINSIALRRVDGGIPLAVYGAQMSLDTDSWTWSFSATLRADQLPLVQRGTGADPVELEATVNGVPYRFRVERVSRDRQFASNRISIGGRGLSAMLAAPYAPAMSFANAQARTAQQLMADALTINGASIGWALDWRIDDWAVPAGAWSLQGSYIDAINDIAGAAGAYVQPHPTEQILRILPRYPSAPWTWSTTTPDVVLPAAVVAVEAIEWVDRPSYNRVFVGGVGAGVFGPITRAGTAGDQVAPQVTHALITAPAAHRQRGLAVLADTGRQAHMQLSLPVLPETGLLLPGTMLRYTSTDGVRTGIVRSTGLDGSLPILRQKIGVETHVAA